MDNNSDNTKKINNYPKTLGFQKWETYIGRKLKPSEKKLINNYKIEKKMNVCIKNIHNRAKSKGLCIHYLTNLDGNCMFESLQHHNFFDTIENFRKNIATLMLFYRNKKYLFDGQENSLEELFQFTNEVEYVIDPDTGKLYKYNYDMMCIDLWNNNNWSRLPTQLIMMTISYFYNIKFNIINDENDYETTIYCGDSSKNSHLDVYLGHITETHYIPLVECTINKNRIPKHNEAREEFMEWVAKLAQ